MSLPNVLDKLIAYFSPQRALRRQAARQAIDVTYQYRGAQSNRLRADWVLGNSQTTPSAYELQELRNRSRDLNCNDPIASGATDTMGHNIVGRGLRPQSRIRPEIVGLSEARARALQKQAEYIWQTWTPMADSGNRLNFDEIQFLALRKIIEDGEIIALPVMANEPWRQIRRVVELLEADRLSDPKSGLLPGSHRQGVEVGRRGEPLAYWLTPFDPKTGKAANPQRVEARDGRGRPRVLHVFRTSRPGQLRGVPFFAPVLTYFKDLADYLEAEVVAARVAACLAVFITKTDPYQGAAMYATDTQTNNQRLQSLEPGMLNYLALGENINVVDPKRGGETFNAFVEGVLRIIGVSLGLPYELLVKDFSKTNYSSARAALLEGRRNFTNWRSWFAAKFCCPIYDLVLEEAYLRGQFEAPNFYDYRSEYTRAQWIGGGWGWVDPVKEVQSSKLAIDYGLSTLAEEAAGQGRDWEETLEQRAREEAFIKELGLVVVSALDAASTGRDKKNTGEDDNAENN